MVKTFTLSIHPTPSEIKKTSLKPYKKQIVSDELIPSDETIQNILNYSKALRVHNTSLLGSIDQVDN